MRVFTLNVVLPPILPPAPPAPPIVPKNPDLEVKITSDDVNIDWVYPLLGVIAIIAILVFVVVFTKTI